MKQLLIRPAREDDIDAMTALLGELFTLEADFEADAGRQRTALEMLLANDTAEVLVAELDRRVVGMCTMQRLVSTAEGGWAGLVEDVVIAEGFRGRGIGSQLLAAMERRAIARGITRLQLLADRGNTAALGFYDAAGWRRTALNTLRKRL